MWDSCAVSSPRLLHRRKQETLWEQWEPVTKWHSFHVSVAVFGDAIYLSFPRSGRTPSNLHASELEPRTHFSKPPLHLEYWTAARPKTHHSWSLQGLCRFADQRILATVLVQRPQKSCNHQACIL